MAADVEAGIVTPATHPGLADSAPVVRWRWRRGGGTPTLAHTLNLLIPPWKATLFHDNLREAGSRVTRAGVRLALMLGAKKKKNARQKSQLPESNQRLGED